MAGPYGQAPFVAGPYRGADPYGAGQPGGPQLTDQFGQNLEEYRIMAGRRAAAGTRLGGWRGTTWPERKEHRIMAGRGPSAGARLGRAAGTIWSWRARFTRPAVGRPLFWRIAPFFGSWRTAGPEQGQGWAPGPSGGPGI